MIVVADVRLMAEIAKGARLTDFHGDNLIAGFGVGSQRPEGGRG